MYVYLYRQLSFLYLWTESLLDFVGFASWLMLILFVSILVPMVSACRSGVSSTVRSSKIFWVAVPGNVYIYIYIFLKAVCSRGSSHRDDLLTDVIFS